MISKNTIIDKVLKHYMGAYDFATGDFKNKTVPILKKLEQSSKTTDDLVDSLLDSKILKSNVILTETGEKWNPIREPLIVFLSSHTHWKFWEESFNDYLVRTEGSNTDQGSVLFFTQDASLTSVETENLRQWLLKE